MPRRCLAMLCAVCLTGCTTTAGADEAVWIEGEAATQSTFVKHNWYSNVVTDRLSGGAWLSHYGAQPGQAAWRFSVKEGGSYTGWARVNVVRSQYGYRLDGSPEAELDITTDLRGRQNLVDTLDHRFIAWTKIGQFDLAPGDHTFVLRSHSNLENSGGVDALVFVNYAWAPSGLAKPEPPTPIGQGAPDAWFAFMPDDDAFSPNSILDMSALVEAPAGRHGFVQAVGPRFQFSGTGQPVKFWGVVANMTATPELQEQQARLYAKYGINMVRQHPVEAVLGRLRRGPDGRPGFDQQRLDRWDRWFATLKRHGIYMTWSCFYPHIIGPDDGYPADLYAELEDRDGGKSTSGLVNFMPQLQDAEWRWIEALLQHVNPYTGLRYLDDPALAVIETHNEDCIFWHAPLNDLANPQGKYPRHAAILRRGWAAWLQQKYGNDQALRQAWGQGLRHGDSVTSADLALYGAWEMGPAGPTRNNQVSRAERRRMGDFIQYLAETQRGYYERREKRLRDLGYQASTLTTAWRAGGAAADPANLWCDMAAGAITRHNYFGGGDGNHNVAAGKVNNGMHVTQPGGGLLASGFYQVEDKPFVMTEWTSKTPNEWKAEAAPLIAFYGLGLQGWDASYHFAAARPRFGSGWPDMSSYVTETPHYLGQFPALAFAVYKGHLTESPIVAGRRLKPAELFGGFDPLSQDFTGGGYDDKALQGSLATPPEVFAIGRVTIGIGDDVKPASKADWDRYWDRGQQLVRSVTGEHAWHYGRGLVTIQTRKTQAVIGFAGDLDLDLPGVTVNCRTPFVSLIFTPLDDQPLTSSKQILITALARDIQTGAEYNEDGTRLLNAGSPPLLLEPVQATIAFKGDPLASCRPVDMYGVPIDVEVERQGQTITIDGRYRSYYYEVRR